MPRATVAVVAPPAVEEREQRRDLVARSSMSTGIEVEPSSSRDLFEVLERIELGSHVMFIGEVTESKVLSQDTPCTYAYYHKAIKPKF